MRCDGCGCQFAARDLKRATRNEASESAGMSGQKTHLVAMTLCPNCVANRAATQSFILWVAVLLPIGLGLTMALGSLIASLQLLI